ncbi:citrulline utilization hydrolase CtlX [Arthrobacter sp. H-02-3]|uniref:citrulline utilization hydrolase CtlX n=1 Tax=Arthrobacter sp. H-02-3 TaxID=2703675 RepID=UPI000DD21FA8|nr:arginine deiminase-related protein [Arthrobacter sp. H-02-3]PVZ60378.1 amidinotransferase [Arthrobacter sp. H-02-3]
MSVQAPSAVVLVRPHNFMPNEATAVDNAFQTAFQTQAHSGDRQTLAAAARHEVTGLAAALEAAGVTVHLFEDHDETRPDSVFPNNWLSTHAGGRIGIFPMYAPNRRHERRSDILDFLKTHYRVQDVIDYSGLEMDSVFLEGTGAMVLDHGARVAYAARSRRADPVALERFCTNFGYEPMLFDAVDVNGTAVYHTNVMMTVATGFAMVGADLIPSAVRRREVMERLAAGGRRVIELSPYQISNFAGNAIELQGVEGRVLALSRRALGTLTAEQKAVIERSCTLLPVEVPTIELAGGSVRCMIAGIHLDRRPVPAGVGG